MATKEKELLFAFTNNEQFVIKVYKEGSNFSVQTSKEYQAFKQKDEALSYAKKKINLCIDGN